MTCISHLSVGINLLFILFLVLFAFLWIIQGRIYSQLGSLVCTLTRSSKDAYIHSYHDNSFSFHTTLPTTLQPIPKTTSNSISVRQLSPPRTRRYTPRYSKALCVYYCFIVYPLIWPPLWLYLLICSIHNFLYNSGPILAEALSYSFRTSS